MAFENPMPVVFVIAADWKLRTAVRAELLEMGINAVGMNSRDDVNSALLSGGLPDAVVLEAIPEFLADSRIQGLMRQVPTILIASRTVSVPIPESPVVLYRPVRIAEILDRVGEVLARGHVA